MADQVPPSIPPNLPGGSPAPPPPPPLRPVLPTGDPLGAETALDATPSAATGLPPHIAAGLACLLTFISGIIFLLLEKKDQFVRFWAMQAVIFGVIWFGADLALMLVGSIFSHVPVLNVLVAVLVALVRVALYIGGLIILVVMLVKSFTGKSWDMPLIGNLARQQLAKLNV